MGKMRVGEATIFHGGHGVVLKSEEDGMEEEDEVARAVRAMPVEEGILT
jgi:hypothetical protein